MQKRFPRMVFGSIVVGLQMMAARVWQSVDGFSSPLNIQRIVGCDFPIRAIELGGNEEPIAKSDSFADRQVRAFGAQGQLRIESFKVGIVGLGGTGSLMAEGLARLGVRRFVLVDQDRVDETNRNRLLGLRESDVRQQRYKASIARREIRFVRSDAEVEVVRDDTTSVRSATSLRMCDLIVSATDNHYSRFFLQTLSFQHLIPLLNLGVAITAHQEKVFDACGVAELFLPDPKRPCLLCAGQIDTVEMGEETIPLAQRNRMVEQGYITGAAVPDPAVRPLNAAIAALALSIFHNYLCGFSPATYAVAYNMLRQRIDHLEHAKDPQCRICGPAGVVGFGDARPTEYDYKT